MTVSIDKFIWDLTYACPLRCIHCYSESGRRPARTLDRASAMRVVDVILSAHPTRISLSGGEPLLVKWCAEAAQRLRASGCEVTLFTSGWLISEAIALDLAQSVATVAVSVDGTDVATHDKIRGRLGGFERAMTGLQLLGSVRGNLRRASRPCYSLGIDFTLMRSNARSNLEEFVEHVTSTVPELDFIRFGAVIPTGLAAEEDFEEAELLTIEELVDLIEAREDLASRARNGASVMMTDVRYFLPNPQSDATDLSIAQIEPDGALRAFPIYEAKVGNILEEPLDILWSRAMKWRADPFVSEHLRSIRSMADWARVTRILDRRYGSPADRQRMLQRQTF